MNKEVKTLGYLLKHYTDSQCYDQYIPLKWLKEIIEKRKDKMSLYDADCEMKGYQYLLDVIEE
jgi:hypothetical protein